MAAKPFKIQLIIEDNLGRIVIEHETNDDAYPSERGRVIAHGVSRLKRMLAAEYPGEFSEDEGGF